MFHRIKTLEAQEIGPNLSLQTNQWRLIIPIRRQKKKSLAPFPSVLRRWYTHRIHNSSLTSRMKHLQTDDGEKRLMRYTLMPYEITHWCREWDWCRDAVCRDAVNEIEWVPWCRVWGKRLMRFHIDAVRGSTHWSVRGRYTLMIYIDDIHWSVRGRYTLIRTRKVHIDDIRGSTHWSVRGRYEIHIDEIRDFFFFWCRTRFIDAVRDSLMPYEIHWCLDTRFIDAVRDSSPSRMRLMPYETAEKNVLTSGRRRSEPKA